MTRVLPLQRPIDPDDPRRRRGRYFKMVHVRESKQQLALLSPPKGISFTVLNRLDTKGKLDGNIVCVYCNNVNPNDFEKRELDDIDDFIARNLTVINDSPKGFDFPMNRKFETIIDSEHTRKLSFNEQIIKIDETLKKILNKDVEKRNDALKSAPYNSEDVEDKLDEEEVVFREI